MKNIERRLQVLEASSNPDEDYVLDLSPLTMAELDLLETLILRLGSNPDPELMTDEELRVVVKIRVIPVNTRSLCSN